MIFKNAKYDDAEHKSFSLVVELDDGFIVPFTYLCDGSDDASSVVAQAVGDAFRAGDIEVEEFVYVAPTQETLAAQARQMRDALLLACDYCAMPDYPKTQEQAAALLAYRQALRDITAQTGFPNEIDWPDKPDWIK